MGCVSEFIDKRGKNMSTGGNYITAAQAQQNAMQASQLQNQYHQQLQLANAAGNGAFGQFAQGGYAQQPIPEHYRTFGMLFGANLKLPTLEELDDPDSAFNLPVEALATMWGARFGYRWVPDEDTTAALEENEDLWLRAVRRLYDAGMLVYEQYRRPENDATKVAWKLIEKDHGNR